MSLANKALLVNLRISQWTGRKLDKRATATVESSHDTRGKVGNYTKKLLPGAAELENIQRLTGATRAFFYEQTLPWFSDGSRILSSKNYLDFTAAFRTKKAEFDRAVEEFLAVYPSLRDQARNSLGDLFSESEYPSVGRLRSAFSCEVAFMPLPDVSDFRTEILDSEKEAFLSRMRETESDAMKDCWTRLYDVVSKAANKLSTPDAIFRDSLIENIVECCTLLPKLNFNDDPQLENMRKQVEKLVSTVNPDTCRESMVERNDVAAKLADITGRMSAFMGV